MKDTASRLVIEALRLDRRDAAEISRRLDRALELGVGGFILFGGEAGAVARLTERARRAAGRPLWMAADLERGAGQQFRGLTELPPPAALAAAPSPGDAAERAGTLTGREARSVGVDWVLAPVVDLDAERRNPIVATRSFGSDAARVAELAARWIDGCQSSGALACAKHFPGHGRTTTDSHVELPLVEAGAEELERDLLPFAALVPRVATMMAAHVAYPALGSDRPATRAPEIVRGILRERFGFGGPVATDAMIMAGVGADGAAAAVEAVGAGCDLVLYPGDAAATIAALERAANEAPIFADRLREALATADRGLARLEGLPETMLARRPVDDPVAEETGGAAKGFDAIGFARETIVDRSGAALDGWRSGAPTSVVAVSDDPDVGPPAGRAGPLGAPLRDALAGAGWNVVPEGAGGIGEQTVVLLAATPRGWKGHGGVSAEAAGRVRAALDATPRGLLVVLGHARLLEDLDSAGIAAWSTEDVMERAAAAWIAGRVGGAG